VRYDQLDQRSGTKNGARFGMIKEDRLLRVGVLGCGPIAQAAHFDSCIKARNAELYAICDVAKDLVSRAATGYQPSESYLNYDEMLADPKVEAVIIAVADQFHVEAASRALAAGKHVLVEKPLGTTIGECQALRDEAKASGLTVQIGSMKRFDPGIAFARRFLQEEGGALLALKAWYCDSIYRYVQTDNLQPTPITSSVSKKPDGNPKANKPVYYLLGHGSHLFDTALFLGGEIVSVQAELNERFGAFCWMIMARFAGGFTGQLDLTIPVRMDWHEGFQIYAEHGSVIGKTFNPWYLRSSEVECFSVRDGQYHRTLGADAHFYKLQLEGFADTILKGMPQRGATVEDGLAVVRTLVAVSESCRSGKRVQLADVAGAVR
jgi:predicted dehydrogenase